jgi:hypothetical protein
MADGGCRIEAIPSHTYSGGLIRVSPLPRSLLLLRMRGTTDSLSAPLSTGYSSAGSFYGCPSRPLQSRRHAYEETMAEFPGWTWSSLAGGRKPSRRKESARPVLALLLVNAERDCRPAFGLNGRASWSNRLTGYMDGSPISLARSRDLHRETEPSDSHPRVLHFKHSRRPSLCNRYAILV